MHQNGTSSDDLVRLHADRKMYRVGANYFSLHPTHLSYTSTGHVALSTFCGIYCYSPSFPMFRKHFHTIGPLQSHKRASREVYRLTWYTAYVEIMELVGFMSDRLSFQTPWFYVIVCRTAHRPPNHYPIYRVSNVHDSLLWT